MEDLPITEECSLLRIRELIIAAHSVSDDGIVSFDTSNAQSLGYSESEIDATNRILAIGQIECLDELFKSKIIFCVFGQSSAPYINVHYIGFAKIIFVVHKDHDFYSHIYEEDLDEWVAKVVNSLVDLEYVWANSHNDAYGNPI